MNLNGLNRFLTIFIFGPLQNVEEYNRNVENEERLYE
jgi:hypothetical protein